MSRSPSVFTVLTNTSQREQAEEGQYIKRQEAERLKKLKESIAKDQAEVVSSSRTMG